MKFTASVTSLLTQVQQPALQLLHKVSAVSAVTVVVAVVAVSVAAVVTVVLALKNNPYSQIFERETGKRPPFLFIFIHLYK